MSDDGQQTTDDQYGGVDGGVLHSSLVTRHFRNDQETIACYYFCMRCVFVTASRGEGRTES